jgi:hypothetical protein
MKKLLLVALVAAMVAGTAEARRGCGRRNECAPKCEVECAPRCAEKQKCVGPARIACTTYSDDITEDKKPNFCYLVPSRRNLVKHVHKTCHTSYACAEKPCCAVDATEEQLNYFREIGAIESDCN